MSGRLDGHRCLTGDGAISLAAGCAVPDARGLTYLLQIHGYCGNCRVHRCLRVNWFALNADAFAAIVDPTQNRCSVRWAHGPGKQIFYGRSNNECRTGETARSLSAADCGCADFRADLVRDGDRNRRRGDVSYRDRTQQHAAPDDDYLCWTPTPARIRIAGATESVSVVLTNRSDDGGGEVVFQTLNGQRPTSADFAPKPTMIVTLSEKGSWSHFWVAGTRPSTEDKDTSIVVTRVDDGVELTAIPLMVRVRKDASTLTPEEISRFLSALGSHHAVGDERIESRYMKYTEAHQMAFNYGIHFYDQDLHKLQLEPYPPLFLAWHRAFLLSLERELQSLDPTVSIPYWRFDRDDTDGKIFPWDSWERLRAVIGWRKATPSCFPIGILSMGGDRSAIRRWYATLTEQRHWCLPNAFNCCLKHADSSGDLIHNSYIEISEQLEYAYHNGVHTGINGVLFSEASPADPLFSYCTRMSIELGLYGNTLIRSFDLNPHTLMRTLPR